MSDVSSIRVWPSMAFRDAEAMIGFLSAIGFAEHETYRDESGHVIHAEWVWGGGGIMFGQVRESGVVRNVGQSSTYLVTDDPDAVFDQAIAAGASVVRPMVDQDYGGRGGTFADPEGNQWSVGSFQPS